ncbi:hypothetical protein IF650_04125 [Cellulosimicrobium terreum]|nr:hypothetical protein [Cellulosimicrobium terreum]
MSRDGQRRAPGTPALPRWQALLLGAVPAGVLGVMTWRTWDDVTSGDAAVLVPFVLVAGLCLAGIVACVSFALRAPHADRWFRVATVLAKAAVIGFFGFVIVFGLFAPALLASPGSGRAPDTPGEAVVAGLIALAVLLWMVVASIRRRRRRR